MVEFEKLCSITLLSISAWSALALLLDGRGYLQVNRYFALLIGIVCLSQMFTYTLLIASPAAVLLGQLALASIWLKGPLVLLLTRLLIGKGIQFKSICWYFGGFPLALTINILLPQHQFWWHLAGAFLSFAILLYAAILLWQHRHRIAHIYGKFKNTGNYWLLFIVVGMLALLLVDIALFSCAIWLQIFPFAAAKLATFAASIYLICIALFSIYRPEVFFRSTLVEQDLPQTPDDFIALQACVDPAVLATEVQANRNLELSDSIAFSLHQELERLMTVEYLFKQDELSLGNIARLLNISVHQTSELLNVHMHSNFYSYVNGYRLKYAAKLLKDPECRLRVLDIAFESGFNNKNSFYREFRHVYGVTPTAYRHQQLMLALP